MVDDTIVYRKIVSDVLAEIPNVNVVGTANNGKIALSKIKTLKPDLITLDIEMPEMDGLQVLEALHQESSDIGVIMLSTLTHEGGEATIKALELGAFDFIPKPQSGSMNENRSAINDLLTPMVKAFTRRREIKVLLKGKIGSTQYPDRTRERNLKGSNLHTRAQEKEGISGKTKDIARRMQKISASGFKGKSEIVAIGISTGGPNALARMMPLLPADIGVPIVIVQHMPPIFTQSLAKSLDTKCQIEVKEAANGEILKPNVALIAPGGKQMKIVAAEDGRNRKIKITDDPPENSCKPSADYLFRSVASHYVGRATGVIMTGMGSDGSTGLKLMKRNGSFVIAQNEETCTVFGMPKEPIESNIADIIAPLDTIAAEITKTVKRN